MDAVGRIFGVLETLNSAERPMSLVEIRDAVGHPQSSVAGTLRGLVDAGYLHHDRSTRTYAPTILLADLGGWVASRYAPGKAVLQAAEDVAERTGENVAIAHRNDIRLQYLSFIPGRNLAPTIRVGTTRLLCRSGLGWALLSFLSQRAIQSIVRRTNAAVPAEDSVDLDPLLAMVDRCRTNGYVRALHTVRTGYGVIAMPVRDTRLQLVIGVSTHADRIIAHETEIVSFMKQALAHRIG
jgi:IclR family KDG regulon transcriptional repressor